MGVRFLANSWPYDRWEGGDALSRAVQTADALGIDGWCLSEHLFTSPEHREGFGNDTWYDPFILASHLAARTQRIRIVFKVLVVPLRHPLHTARMAATLDVLSAGRLTLGVAAGWCEPDFRAVGVPFEARGSRTDEYLATMRSWWTDEQPSAAGTFGAFEDVIAQPRCVQVPHVPLWIGGSGEPSFRRAADFGDGWAPMPANHSFDEAARMMRRIRERAETQGRDPGALDFVWRLGIGDPDPAMVRVHRSVHAGQDEFRSDHAHTAQEAIEAVGRFAEAGVTDLELGFAWNSPQDYEDKLRWIADAVLPGARAAATTA